MHTYKVNFTDGTTQTVYSERIHFTPTHIVFDNTPNSLGMDEFGGYQFRLEAAFLATNVKSVFEPGRTHGR